MSNKKTPNGYHENRRALKDKIWSFWQGDFIEKYLNTWTLQLFIAFVIYLIFNIYNNYAGLRNLKHINTLKRELTELRLEKASLSSTLMGEGRISVIEERVKKEQLDIAIPKTPPIVIDK